MFIIEDGRSSFYQWDIDRKLIVQDETISEVHFCNKTDDNSLVCEVYTEGQQRLVNVPNVLLTENYRIYVYAYDDNHTKHTERFEVLPRSKPADYIYTEEELKEWEKLRADMVGRKGEYEGSELFNSDTNSVTDMYAHAEGEYTTAGWRSHTEGYMTVADETSHAEGRLAMATGKGSHAEGLECYEDITTLYENTTLNSNVILLNGANQDIFLISPGDYICIASANGDFKTSDVRRVIKVGSPYDIGDWNVDLVETVTPITLNASFIGSNYYYDEETGTGTAPAVFPAGSIIRKAIVCKATNYGAHAEGVGTTASGAQAHTEGRRTAASGAAAHAEGYETNASGDQSHAEGRLTQATAKATHAEGESCEATKSYAHAEGFKCVASGAAAHAQGSQTRALHEAAFTTGLQTESARTYQTVCGKYNDVSASTNKMFVVANGTKEVPNNAFAVDTSGNIHVDGGIILTAPNGTKYRFYVNNSGTLTKTVYTG